MPNGKCRMHGGSSLSGLASPSYQHGRYSKYLPTRLAARYQEAKADGDLLALRDEVALTDARLADLLGRVDTGESGALWQQARASFDAFKAAQSKTDLNAARTALGELESTLTRGEGDWHAWDEIAKLLEQRRRLVESERRRMVDMQQTITAERAMLLIGRLAGIIQAHVTDRGILAAISADIGKLVMAEPASIAGDADAGEL